MTLRPTTLPELAEVISTSATRGQPLRIMGQGTWLDGGAPVRTDAAPLHLDAFGGIIEYEPGDLTITVGAATTIAELDVVTAAYGQVCPLSPWGGDAGSVGATIATATAGPYAHALGLPRDLVLGLECVDGTGKVLRPGGKVVKNVAGFDLVRLMTGSWGSLAAITRMSLRLRARPAVDETWVVAIDDDLDEGIIGRVDAVTRGPTPPIAYEVVNAPLSRLLGLAAQPHVLARFSGSAGLVAAARLALVPLGIAERAEHSLWQRLRSADANASSVHRMSGDALSCWAWGTVLGGDGDVPLLVHCSWARRTARVIVPAESSFSIIGVQGAAVRWSIEQGGGIAPLPDGVARLNRRIKAAFDPANILNPGIMG